MRLPLSPQLRRFILIAADLLVIFLLSLSVRQWIGYHLLAPLAWFIFLDAAGVYEIRNLKGLRPIVGAAILALFPLILSFILIPSMRLDLILHYLSVLLALTAIRLINRMILYQKPFLFRVAILANGYEQEVMKTISQFPEFELITCCHENGGDLNREEIDAVLVMNGSLPGRMNNGLPVVRFERLYEILTGRTHQEEIKGLTRDCLMRRRPIYDLIKRTCDLLGATVGLILYGLLLPAISLLIKIDSSGPIFYKQRRTGVNNRPYTLWKLRTMVKDAEKGKAVWAQERDPRVTRIGRLLRKTRLDEFAQLINILRGEMSAVGPRPERPEMEEELRQKVPNYELRYLVKPGMAGWAMVNYGYIASIEDALIRHEFDIYYIKYRSLYLDIKIFLRAVVQLVMMRGR